ncbi:MAG TPA: CDP-alcohol phosphatidyltransferase family protein [Chitinophagaceae bacterium]|nr:CDP-alcohol phosphatidyltransferase family protein [Chitinophagaceae bacterium]
MKQLPNIFTLINLFSGCLAIVFALQLDVSFMYQLEGQPIMQNIQASLWMASIFIGISAIVDFLDGFLARLMKVPSEMGKQLDSLSDVVSFGVAPGIILYQLLRMSVIKETDAVEASMGWAYAAFLVPCFAAWRLAKFNIDTRQTYGFRGVPTPAIGVLVASLPLILYYDYFDGAVTALLLNKWVLYLVIAMLCYLMVADIPILGLKFKDYSVKNNIPKIILLAVAAIAAFTLGWLAVPAVFIVYIILSLALREPQNLQSK